MGRLVRYMPDGEGLLVTYVEAASAADLIHRARSTIRKWAQAGLVRSSMLRSRQYVALVDAARVELGLVDGPRTPEHLRLRNQQLWRARQDRTIPAEHNQERWDDFEEERLIELYEAGAKLELMARALGRTWCAVNDRLDVLRDAGLIPHQQPRTAEWLDEALRLMTAREREAVAA